MTKLRKIGRLFVIKTRLEAYLVTYAIAVGAVERGVHYMQNYPGNGGVLLAAAGNFTLVNKTGAEISSLQIRRVGTNAWQSLGGNPANGSRVAVAFANPDCAFDIKATLAGGQSATFSGVNLCDVTTVTLNRGPSGDVWVDYD